MNSPLPKKTVSTPDVTEALLPLSFSLHTNPGAYVMIAGAGMSYGAVPVAWEVLADLIIQVAAIEKISIERSKAETWYRERFDTEPTYELVLEKLGPTPQERQALLRRTFEPDGKLPEPTEAHRSAARLMKTGAIRIVVTMNFDRLFEQALRDEGIEPLIIATDEQARAMRPLHTVTNCVIHLHGDYQDASSLRNTVDELSIYPSSLRALIGQIAREYGLIIAGWSAKYDPALRNILDEAYGHQYSTTWIDPADPNPEASELLTRLRGQYVRTTAGQAIGHLTDAVESLATRNARNPLTLPVAIETAKRELSGGHTSITVHDRLTTELRKLHALDDLSRTDGSQISEYLDLVKRVEEACAVATALIAILAYWGSPETDRWWIDEVERFARTTPASGTTAYLESRRLVGTHLFYAAGIGALAAQRYDTLRTLLQLSTPSRKTARPDPISDVLSASNVYQYSASTGFAEGCHRESVRPILDQALTLTSDALDTAWQLFEILTIAATLTKHPGFEKKLPTLITQQTAYDRLLKQSKMAEEDPNQQPLAEAAWARLPAAEKAMKDARQSLANLISIGLPHIQMSDLGIDQAGWISPVLEHLQRELLTDQDAHPLMRAGIAKTSDALHATLDVVHLALKTATSQKISLTRQIQQSNAPARRTSYESDEIWLDFSFDEQ